MGSCPSKPGEPETTGSPAKPTCRFKKGDRVKRLGDKYGKLGKVTDVIYNENICSSVTVDYDDGTEEVNSPTYFKLLSRESCPFKVGSRVTHKTEFYDGVVTEINFLDDFSQEQDVCTMVKVLVDVTKETKEVDPKDLKINKRKTGLFPRPNIETPPGPPPIPIMPPPTEPLPPPPPLPEPEALPPALPEPQPEALPPPALPESTPTVSEPGSFFLTQQPVDMNGGIKRRKTKKRKTPRKKTKNLIKTRGRK